MADPVREIRKKSWDDVDDVTTEVVSALDKIKQSGPINKKGKPEWKAFDWTTQCHIDAAKVYATAGMRLAEQKNRARSAELWEKLEREMVAKVGNSVDVSVRTISGYEEGLYAWLAVRKMTNNNDFGIVEMGGASSQITFPCPQCDSHNDAVKTIMIDGRPLQIYSYSFLGLGQDKATEPGSLGFPELCAFGIGITQDDWKKEDCANEIFLRDEHQCIRDPYNYRDNKRDIHYYNCIPTYKNNIKKWFLTGAFNYMKASNIHDCCLNESTGCYQKEKKDSCFKAVYLEVYLEELNIPLSSEKMDASWTQGAVLCAADDCLQKTTLPVCRWSDKGCL